MRVRTGRLKGRIKTPKPSPWSGAGIRIAVGSWWIGTVKSTVRALSNVTEKVAAPKSASWVLNYNFVFNIFYTENWDFPYSLRTPRLTSPIIPLQLLSFPAAPHFPSSGVKICMLSRLKEIKVNLSPTFVLLPKIVFFVHGVEEFKYDAAVRFSSGRRFNHLRKWGPLEESASNFSIFYLDISSTYLNCYDADSFPVKSLTTLSNGFSGERGKVNWTRE